MYTSTSIVIDDAFLASSQVVLNSILKNETLFSMALRLTCHVINCQLKDYNHQQILERINANTKTIHDINNQFFRMQRELQNLISKDKQPISIPIVNMEIRNNQLIWQDAIAPYIWDWIHIVSFYIDINAGQIEKENFIHFIHYTIQCVYCNSHYGQVKHKLIKSIENGSLTDIFLMLHTIIASNKNSVNSYDENAWFDFDFNLINIHYKQEYFKRFIAIDRTVVQFEHDE